MDAMTFDPQLYALRGVWRARWAGALWCGALFTVYQPAVPVPRLSLGIGSVGYLVLSNLALLLVLRSTRRGWVQAGAFAVVMGDALLITGALLAFAADRESQDLWTVLLIPLVEAALLHKLRGALLAAAAAPLILLVHIQVGKVPSGDPVLVDLLYRFGLLLVAAIMVALLADSLRQVLGELTVAREEATHRALHDPLTGLANRILFDQRVRAALARPPVPPRSAAVLFVDLDDFKAVNDTLGHQAGDELLVTVAQRLREAVGEDGVPARFGGDEFAVLVEAVDPGTAGQLAERVLGAVQRPVALAGATVTVPASVGVALGGYGTDAGALLADADAAMYATKSSGKGGWRLYEPEQRGRAERRLRLRSDLVDAVGGGALRVVYQPIVALDGGQVVAVEALLRWRHPECGELAPDEFVPLAEETGLIVPIGRWVLREACAQVRRWQREHPGAEGLGVHVNVSGVQLRHPELVGHVEEALAAGGLLPRHLTLELTESVPLLDPDEAAERLGELRRVGARIALDDVGTGHATLAWLHRFPLDTVKVAREFVEGLGGRPRDEAVARGILDMARAMGITAVAEGVQTPRQADRLRELGCDLAQGHLLARPLECAEVALLLGRGRVAAGADR
jgi:diguanylate cyclase (GGDEF)-like protein